MTLLLGVRFLDSEKVEEVKRGHVAEEVDDELRDGFVEENGSEFLELHLLAILALVLVLRLTEDILLVDLLLLELFVAGVAV
eukprot:CAMPEP_0170512588 /NCGR_PEP_ID=MMETSP0208-20121228/66933_1 /TAXON_ID=197538 /ORGANISM="Strombidium inclinatum, Strain S3" /LENGTH=81 /DNA_ID=CAMNT_0010796233 /DNA_START=676 /DNA_END=921 /DNA_ORIENTATION=-